jgi:hypothetical protein
MRFGGTLFFAGVLCASAGCSKGNVEPSGPRGLDPAENDLMVYGQEQIEADDPRNRIRRALRTLGQDDKIPENATQEELEALVQEKVDKGAIPKDSAEKLLKVLQSANAHNARLERMDQELFGENTH